MIAVALGAKIIEKHFTLDKNLSGPDHKTSLSTVEVFEMMKDIRETEKILGSYKKKPTKSESKNIKVVRKSIVAKNNIKKGDKLSEENLTTKRPALGISPMKWRGIINTIARKNYRKDDFI